MIKTTCASAAADEKLTWCARVRRKADKEAIADKSNDAKHRADYQARKALRHAIDMADRRRRAATSQRHSGGANQGAPG